MENNENDETLRYNVRVKITIAVLLTFIITFCGSIFVYDKYLGTHQMLVKNYESSGNIEQDLNQLRTVLEANYKGEIDEEKCTNQRLKDM